MVLVDSNVLLDIFTADPDWLPWSQSALADALLDAVLARLIIQRAELPWEAAHVAGQAFMRYRHKGGVKTSPLPDFYIGAALVHY